MSDGLREALEGSHREVWPRAPESAMRLDIPIYERRVREWHEKVIYPLRVQIDGGPDFLGYKELVRRLQEQNTEAVSKSLILGQKLHEAKVREAGLREIARKALEPDNESITYDEDALVSALREIAARGEE